MRIATWFTALALALAGAAGMPFVEGSDDTEGLSRSEVQRVIQRNVPRLKSCFELSTAPRGTSDGRIILAFKVGVQGKIRELRIESKSDLQPGFFRCVEQKLGDWTFPLPRGGMEVEVQYPLMFRLRPQAVANKESP